MADPTKGEGGEPQDPKGGEANAQDPQQSGQQPQDPKPGEGGKPQDPDGGEGNTVNAHKYERDMANKDKEIESLKAQLKELTDAKAASGDQTAQLRKELDEMKQSLADEKANSALSKAGCIDLDLARTALAAYDGDVAKLKEAKPYLFSEPDKTHRSTGGRPAGGATNDEQLEHYRKVAGLPAKK
ncbi:MAG: hypothetical protein IKG69_03840 [Atopobiaceae bacterium]|nr:hypothetical protein [Atopobiaceae bacterium]MBR3384325.1 hypothetical protein [Atopobiaceae bacterium]